MQRINAEFDQPVLIHSEDIEWLESPMAGVHRRPLDRVGDEVARATTIVRYAPGSQFSPHIHHGGEEFLVLDGVFQDEHGDYPAGSYLRNPPGTSHTPGSEPGCIIFVKLWQFEPDDDVHVRLTSEAMTFEPVADGISRSLLFQNDYEAVCIYRMAPLTDIHFDNSTGFELFVLDGELQHSDNLAGARSWLRLPAGEAVKLKATESGAEFWCKSGNLMRLAEQLERISAFQS